MCSALLFDMVLLDTVRHVRIYRIQFCGPGLDLDDLPKLREEARVEIAEGENWRTP